MWWLLQVSSSQDHHDGAANIGGSDHPALIDVEFAPARPLRHVGLGGNLRTKS
jgi:hypothetical protein